MDKGCKDVQLKTQQGSFCYIKYKTSIIYIYIYIYIFKYRHVEYISDTGDSLISCWVGRKCD